MSIKVQKPVALAVDAKDLVVEMNSAAFVACSSAKDTPMVQTNVIRELTG